MGLFDFFKQRPNPGEFVLNALPSVLEINEQPINNQLLALGHANFLENEDKKVETIISVRAIAAGVVQAAWLAARQDIGIINLLGDEEIRSNLDDKRKKKH
jgi:hypothetical protein